MKSIKLLAISATLTLVGCQHDLRPVEANPGAADVRQSQFYEAFCGALARQHPYLKEDCDNYIYPPGRAGVRSRYVEAIQESGGSHGHRPTLVFIPGIFGQCASALATPFSDSYSILRSKGYRVLVAPVDGRSSADNNAIQIDQFLRSTTSPREHLVVFGYSKGATDFITALSLRPISSWVHQVDAFVSVAGIIHGTPIADAYAFLYNDWLSKVPFPTCQPGIGDAIGSLSVKHREKWLTSHELPTSIRYFSVSSIAERTHVNPLLLPFWLELKRDGFKSDGQVAPAATRIPGGVALAVMKGDHWAIALPFESSGSPAAKPFKIANHFPRDALIEALLRMVVK